MADVFELVEGLQYLGSDERKAHSITTTEWVSSPEAIPTVIAYDESGYTDVTSTGGATGSGVYPTNSPSVSGDVISLSLLRDLLPGHTYRIEVKFTVSSNIYECFFRVHCPR